MTDTSVASKSEAAVTSGPAKTGYIAEAVADLSALTRVQRLDDIASPALDPERIAYFRAYAQHNFHDPLELGYGTEVLLDMLDALGDRPRWMDLGCGTSTLFWSTGIRGLASVACVDAAPEALFVLRDLAKTRAAPPCYLDGLARFERDLGHLERARAALQDFLIFDIARTWPAGLERADFDLITAFGSLGISNDPKVFANTISSAATRLAPGGVLLGANWLRTQASISDEGYDTSYLTTDFVDRCFAASALQTEEAFTVSIPDPDERWGGVLMWSAQRPTS